MLIRDSAILKQYAKVTGEANYIGLKPTLRIIEDKIIIPITSKALYTALDEAITASLVVNADPLADKYINLLDQCRRVMGPMFCALHAEKADVLFGDAGIQRVETTTNKTAYQYQGTKFKEANLREAEDATELLIAFLEYNKADYAEWLGSENFTKYRSLFIKTGGEFDEYFKTHSPRRNYFAMRNKMQEVELINITKLLGDELFTILKDKDQEEEPTYSEPQKLLVFYLKKIIAYLTVSFSVPVLNVRLAEGGLSVIATASFSQNDNENTRAGINVEQMNLLQKSCNDGAAAWIEKTEKYLKDNKTAFPAWIGFATTAAATNFNLNENNQTVFGL